MTTRKLFNRYFRRLSFSRGARSDSPDRIEAGPDLPAEDAALARELLALALSVQPDREFVARLDGELSRARLTHRPAAPAAPSFAGRIRLLTKTTWGWALPAGAVLLLILIISLLVQMRPRPGTPSAPNPAATSLFASATLTPTALATATPMKTIYIVMQGDTLQSIAEWFNVTPDAIMQANHLTSSGEIYPGQSLIIPTPSLTSTAVPTPAQTIYIVQEGDTLLGIAAFFGVTPDDLFAANHLQSGDVLRVGMSLIIPPSTLPTPTRAASYTVVEDDTLLGIASYFGVTVDALLQANHLTSSGDALRVGQALIIPPQTEPAHIRLPLLTPAPTPVPPGVFALRFYPPAILSYDTSAWVDQSQYTNTAMMVNYLQARGLDDCTIGVQGASDFFPTPDMTITLGSVSYQVTTLADTPAGKTAASYIDTGSTMMQIGAVVLIVHSNSDQWEACKALAESVLSSLQVGAEAPTPTPTVTIDPATQALLAELHSLVAKRTDELLSSTGWVYLHLRRTNSTNCGSRLPNGAFIPCEIEEHDWYELNSQGQVVTVITRQLDPSGNLYQESVTRRGLTRNLTFGFENTTTLTTTYAVDWGFAAEAAQAVADGAAFSQQDRFQESGGGLLALLLVEGDMQREAVFDPQTGGLHSLSTWKQETDGFTQTDSVKLLDEQRVDQPPADALALLDQPLPPYQPLPPQGDPVPVGFDLAHSLLGMRNIAGDSFNSPSFWYGDLYADGPYLVGRVDFGAVPGGYCQRSPDGLKLAFDHETLSNATPAVHQLRWLNLGSPADVHAGPPGLQLVSLPVWGLDSARLAFIACDVDQSCGLYTYDIVAGALNRLADGGNAIPPVWSPDGAEIAFRAGPSEALQTVVVAATSGRINASPAWQPQFVDLKDVQVLNQCMQPPALAPTQPAAPADWRVYTNPKYGFTFRYPSDWTLEVSSNSVLLTKGTLQISIGFRDMKEQASITRTGVGSGDISPDSHISFFGLALTRHVLVYGGKLKAVLYNSAAETPRGDLVFTLSLDDFNLDYDAVDLSAAVQQMADQVVESFAWMPATP